MPRQTTVKASSREAPRQQETFRYGPEVAVQARPVDAYASPGEAPRVPLNQSAAAFTESIQNIQKTSQQVQILGKMKEEEDLASGKAAGARGDEVSEGTNAFFKGYYQMKAVADSTQYIRELDAYNDKNWAKDDADYNQGREAIKTKYTTGMPDEYMTKFMPIDADVSAKLAVKRNGQVFEKSKDTYFTNAGQVINDQLDSGVPPEELRGQLTKLQNDGIAMGLTRNQINDRLLATIGTRALKDPDLAGHLGIFYVKENGIAPVDNAEFAVKVRGYEEKIEREILAKQAREEQDSRIASGHVQDKLMADWSAKKISLTQLEANWRRDAHIMNASDNSFFASLVRAEKQSALTGGNKTNNDWNRKMTVRILMAEEDPEALKADIAFGIENGLCSPDHGMSLVSNLRRKSDSENSAAFGQGKEKMKAMLPTDAEAEKDGAVFAPQGVTLINARDRIVALETEKKRKLNETEIRDIWNEEIKQTVDLMKTAADPTQFMETNAKGEKVPIASASRRREIIHWKSVSEDDPENPGQSMLGAKSRTADSFIQFKNLSGNPMMTQAEYYARIDKMESARKAQLSTPKAEQAVGGTTKGKDAAAGRKADPELHKVLSDQKSNLSGNVDFIIDHFFNPERGNALTKEFEKDPMYFWKDAYQKTFGVIKEKYESGMRRIDPDPAKTPTPPKDVPRFS